MDKRTLLAVILSTIVLAVGFYFQEMQRPAVEELPATESQQLPAESEAANGTADSGSGDTVVSEYSGSLIELYESEDSSIPAAREVVYEDADFIRVYMNTAGGDITQVELLTQFDNGEPLKFFFGTGETTGVALRFGGPEGDIINAPMNLNISSDGQVYEFSRKFVPAGGDEPFTMIRRYTFVPGEYMFNMEIELRNDVNKIIPLDIAGSAYTIEIGPQIGPAFDALSNNSRIDYRKFSYLDSEKDKRRDERNVDPEITQLEERTRWAAINGKYFVAVVTPLASSTVYYSGEETNEGKSGLQLYLTRTEMESSAMIDSYNMYFGPKSVDVLRSYDMAVDNGLGLQDMALDTLIESSWIGWLEKILKVIMNFFYNLIPNWGVAIILLTILVKIVLYPLTHRSYESTARMKEISPKVNALKEKYGDDPQKLNEKTMELYQKEKISPLGGCLPILFQFPFFIAMYSLFNNNFDLRGAVFIPGWINDLSSPEAIFQLGFAIPFVNIDAIRILPVLFLGTQLISSQLMQTPDAQNNSQMKMMTLGMPIMFFFIMYNMPSGLLVYWIFQNVISTGQQLFYNHFIHKKRMEGSKAK